VSAIVATRFAQERSLEPAALATICKSVTTDLRVDTAPDVVAAIEHARTLGAPVLVAGSLFVVGEARAKLLGAPADPVAVSDPPAQST
jgi:folylpolyglutamate synthase/dihydropteroate synthase